MANTKRYLYCARRVPSSDGTKKLNNPKPSPSSSPQAVGYSATFIIKKCRQLSSGGHLSISIINISIKILKTQTDWKTPSPLASKISSFAMAFEI